MSDDDYEDEAETVQAMIAEYPLQIQDLVGLTIQTVAGCLNQVAMGVQAIGNEVLAAGNARRRQYRDEQARREAAEAMGIISERER